MKTYPILIAVTIPLLISSCKETLREVAAKGDVTFARSTFESLARGDSAVIDKIDWPVLTSLGTNVGASYVAMPSGVEQEKFTTAFVTQFATTFRESGGSVEDFSNWRVSSRDSRKTEVAADSANGVLTVIVSERDHKERVSSINILK